jgi:opacity protein-like surface antigen
MKKLLLTAVIVFATLFASAQIMVVTTYDGDQEESIDKLTANMGIGYSISDNIVIGGVKNGDDYDLFARYNYKDDIYLSLQMATGDNEGTSIGVGYSLNVWNSLYIEPNYSMATEKDADGNRDGEFNLGIGYRF